MKNILSSIFSAMLVSIAIAACGGISNASAATTGLYEPPGCHCVLDVTNVRWIRPNGANATQVLYMNGTLTSYTDTAGAFYAKIAASPDFFTFSDGTAVNAANVKRFTCSGTQTQALFIDNTSTNYSDASCVEYAVIQASVN